MKLLEIKNLNKSFDNKKILKDINFSITKGKIIDAFTEATLIKKEENNVKKEEKQNDKKTTIEDIDKKIYTIDDFLETIEFLD